MIFHNIILILNQPYTLALLFLRPFLCPLAGMIVRISSSAFASEGEFFYGVICKTDKVSK